MSKIAVGYGSGTGNTEAMANAVLKGADDKGAETEIITASDFSAGMVEVFDGIAFGCPSMGTEELEESEFSPMFDSIKEKLNGKRIALFGSYGWGDGEWMRNWEADCKSCGAVLVAESVICNDAPDDDMINKCKELGAVLAS